MEATVHLCSKCLAPVESWDRDGDANWSCTHQFDLDAVLLEVEAKVDPYEAYSAQRVYVESGWQPLIEECNEKRAMQQRGELAYLYRDDGLHWNEADRRARWAKIAGRKHAAANSTTFSMIMKDKFIGPIRDQLNRQAFGSGIITSMDVADRVSGLGLDVVAHDDVPPGTAFVVPLRTSPWDARYNAIEALMASKIMEGLV